MTRRRHKLKPCAWCGRVVTKGERVCLTYDHDHGRYHVTCLVTMLVSQRAAGKPRP